MHLELSGPIQLHLQILDVCFKFLHLMCHLRTHIGCTVFLLKRVLGCKLIPISEGMLKPGYCTGSVAGESSCLLAQLPSPVTVAGSSWDDPGFLVSPAGCPLQDWQGARPPTPQQCLALLEVGQVINQCSNWESLVPASLNFSTRLATNHGPGAM